ncbi:MAG: hypothetical protein CMK23_10005 [Porticoccaceae bacterium]|jgi:hypothetical protein|nr:hypothetical protein [Porticoccaceae bacterium]|tara:strand:+ start:6917 stop:7543 length:627 start_codon:yes stop_codon:yes gene_type:complete
MTVRIDDFKTALAGGGARANLFRVNCNWPNGDIQGGANTAFGASATEALSSFMIKTAAMPARTIGEVIVPFRGRQLKVSGDTIYDAWTVQVINDNNFAVRNAFERWQDAINGAATNVSGRGVDASSFDSYTANMEIEQLSRTGAVIKRYVLYAAWPTVVDTIDVSYDSTDTIEEFAVTFAYQWWEANTTSEPTTGRVTADVAEVPVTQ